MANVNVPAVLTAALATFLVGGLWYSPLLFGNAWNRADGRAAGDEGRHPAVVFGLAYVLSVAAAYVLALHLGREASLEQCVRAGAMAGLGLVATCFGVNYLFAGRSHRLWLIDGGYHVVQLTLIGLVLGVWR